MNSIKELIEKEMKAQKMGNIISNFIICVGENEYEYSKASAVDAYTKTVELSEQYNCDSECYVAPVGKKASDPVLTVRDGIIHLADNVIFAKSFSLV